LISSAIKRKVFKFILKGFKVYTTCSASKTAQIFAQLQINISYRETSTAVLGARAANQEKNYIMEVTIFVL